MANSDYYNNLPRKRMGAGVLFFDERDKLLIVKPTYKDHWSIPGGSVEEDESPRGACVREVREEIGIEVSRLEFLCVDYTQARAGKNESLQFIFYGGTLAADQIAGIRLADGELGEYRFLKQEEALPFLNEGLRKRLQKCLGAVHGRAALYLEGGE